MPVKSTRAKSKSRRRKSQVRQPDAIGFAAAYGAYLFPRYGVGVGTATGKRGRKSVAFASVAHRKGFGREHYVMAAIQHLFRKEIMETGFPPTWASVSEKKVTTDVNERLRDHTDYLQKFGDVEVSRTTVRRAWAKLRQPSI
jgi:hypothetical protein